MSNGSVAMMSARPAGYRLPGSSSSYSSLSQSYGSSYETSWKNYGSSYTRPSLSRTSSYIADYKPSYSSMSRTSSVPLSNQTSSLAHNYSSKYLHSSTLARERREGSESANYNTSKLVKQSKTTPESALNGYSKYLASRHSNLTYPAYVKDTSRYSSKVNKYGLNTLPLTTNYGKTTLRSSSSNQLERLTPRRTSVTLMTLQNRHSNLDSLSEYYDKSLSFCLDSSASRKAVEGRFSPLTSVDDLRSARTFSPFKEISVRQKHDSPAMLEQTGKGLKGLLNIGNTCYMASVIQCLSNTKKLINYILKEDYVAELNYSSSMKGDLMKVVHWSYRSPIRVSFQTVSNLDLHTWYFLFLKLHVCIGTPLWGLVPFYPSWMPTSFQKFTNQGPDACTLVHAHVTAFSKLIHELWREVGSQAPVDPAEFKSVFVRFAPCFKGSSEEDAQECLRYLLAGLHEDVNRARARPFRTLLSSEDKLNGLNTGASAWNAYLQVDNSKIVDLFVGQLESMLTCMTCGHHSVTYDPFWDLSLPIPKKMAKVTVKQCLDLFTSEEIMDGKEKPECSVCKKNQKSTKKLLIKKFPQVLVLHLKRFLVNSENNQRAKLTTKVDYKVQNLELKEYSASSSSSSSNCCYDLYAIVTHHGRVNSGHYVAYCQHPFSEQWHSFNDTRVNHLPLEKLVTEDAYLLFYQLKK